MYIPLHFLILRFAQWIFGDSEWALRLPSAFAGWLCIPAIYLLGKRLYSEREGIFSMRMSPGCLDNRRRSRSADKRRP